MHKAADSEALPGYPLRIFSQLSGKLPIFKQRAHSLYQPIDVSVRVTAAPVFDDGSHFCGGQPDYRHAEHHRLANGQSQARVSDRIEEEAILHLKRCKIFPCNFSFAPHALGVHAHQVQRNFGPQILHNIPAEPAAPARQAVNNGKTPLEFTAIADVGRYNYAVLDHPRRRSVVVPHQPVEMRNMNEQNFRVVYYMLRAGRMLLRGVVFQINPRQSLLQRGQYFMLILKKVLPRLE